MPLTVELDGRDMARAVVGPPLATGAPVTWRGSRRPTIGPHGRERRRRDVPPRLRHGEQARHGGALVAAYFASIAFNDLAKNTQQVRRNILSGFGLSMAASAS